MILRPPKATRTEHPFPYTTLSRSRAIIPHFKQDDYPVGIAAGVNEIGKLLALPPDEARARALEAEQQAEKRHSSGNGFMLFFRLAILLDRKSTRLNSSH